jgi:hypothetical protein
MKIVGKITAALALLALASCGGGGNAALSKSFNYGAAQAPTSSEQLAATSAQGAVSSSATFGSAPDSVTASAIVGLADELAASALGGSALAAAGVPEQPHVRGALRTAVTAECTTVTATSVTFNNCQDSDVGYTFTLNGTVSASNGKIDWDIHGSYSQSDQGLNVNLGLHQSGTLTVTATTVVGHSASELSGSVSLGPQSTNFGLDTAAMVDLTYNPDCITAGTVEVKRVWSERPAGATGPDFADAAVKLTWTGCNTVQVQHST